MWRWSGRAAREETQESERPASPTFLRDRLAMLAAAFTVIGLIASFLLSKDAQFLMPGPLTSAHGSIEGCSACHASSGSGKLSWVRGLLRPADPHTDSKACLTCHQMPETALNAHGAASDVLTASTERLLKIAPKAPPPQSARAQAVAFPTHDMVASGLQCATCHQEHQGAAFNLSRISNEQCRSCHVVKFDSFDGHHPEFEAYPFKRRTRIVYDHAGHFGKHYPEVAKKDPAKTIPATCSTCHNSNADKRVMSVAPFEQTCASCHLDQIVGKERASGPKGIAFLTLPGLDLDTLKSKKADIGEWPDASEAELTPFMKVMIERSGRGRTLIERLAGVDLQDLAGASDDQIAAVTELAWEIKGLFHAVISGKTSDLLAAIDMGRDTAPQAISVADLTASIPRDVVVSAHQEWLPNLGAEMANRPNASDDEHNGWSTETTEIKLAGSASPEELFGAQDRRAVGHAGAMRIAEESSGPILRRWNLPTGTPRSIDAQSKDAAKPAQPERGSRDSKAENAEPSPDSETPEQANQSDAAAEADAANAPPADQAEGTAGDQSDDLLFPTDDELRAMKAAGASGESAAANARSDEAASSDAAPKGGTETPAGQSPAVTAATPPSRTAPQAGIAGDLDPESWAEHGGWYRQDYAIYYRPKGHKDKFIASWLVLAGPKAAKEEASPATAIFDGLTGKDAQGSCTKCHSVDDVAGNGRAVNFSPLSAEDKHGRFTNFIHQPHFSIPGDRGCLTCHSLEKQSPYLKSFEHGNPNVFSAGFGVVNKESCQACHTSNMARQDCLLCHSYHVNGVVTPITRTELPVE